MRLHFTKMHGAGNDFVVLDGTREAVELTVPQARRLADRRFGVGADQILVVEKSPTPGVDFRYRIFNASGDEVEHCGNGARCFVRYVHARGLTTKRRIKVETVNNLLELVLGDDGRVTVDMNRPVFEHARIPFEAGGLTPRREGPGAGFERWPLADAMGKPLAEVAVLSMGNPHAVLRVDDVVTAPVATLGPLIEAHPRFPKKVNVGFVRVLGSGEIDLRVYERGAGETLACGTGACAAVVAGLRLGWLGTGAGAGAGDNNRRVTVHTRGGDLAVEWPGDDAHVLMTGPAEFVFEGEIEL
ncbi:MAG: diaminopimelate epimerase [Betaproteobacteria bacterium]|nr:diaminopimelate epimerase [Betaproteobacteria bacterium]